MLESTNSQDSTPIIDRERDVHKERINERIDTLCGWATLLLVAALMVGNENNVFPVQGHPKTEGTYEQPDQPPRISIDNWQEPYA